MQKVTRSPFVQESSDECADHATMSSESCEFSTACSPENLSQSSLPIQVEPDSGDDVFTGGHVSRSCSQKNLHPELQSCPRLEARDPSAPPSSPVKLFDLHFARFALVRNFCWW